MTRRKAASAAELSALERNLSGGDAFFKDDGPAIADPASTKSPVTYLPPLLTPDGRGGEAYRPQQTIRFETFDGLSQMLGARLWRAAAIFDWCRKGRYNTAPPGQPDSRPRHKFTRWYFEQRVLVDVFATANSIAVQREIEEKSARIREYVASSGERFGYLPIVRGAYISRKIVAAARDGEILPLQTSKMPPADAEDFVSPLTLMA